MGRFFTRSMGAIQPFAFFALFVLASLVQGHVIQKRHDIIESAASFDDTNLSNGNETVAIPEVPVFPGDDVDSDHNAKDVINNEENNNVNGVQESKVSSTTDVNNGIEQNFAGHINQTANNETIANSQTSFTKDFSQDDSVENRLPSKPSDKSASNTKSPARISTVLLKEATRADESKEAHATVPISHVPSSDPSEKPKRVDTTFARSTERAVADVEISTVPVSRSTASILSTIPLAPKISATETIRARISSIPPEVAEKRAKYLSEKVDSSSPSSANNPEASWSDLKTVGEVHHNNVTLGKSLAQDESIKSVNGKLDSEEVAEKASVETSSTEKSVDEHETQLQKSNSSQIVDVPDDNSLSSFQSSSNRPTVPINSRNQPTKPTALGGGDRKVVSKDEDDKKEEVEADNSKTEISSRGSLRTKAPNTTTENTRLNPKPGNERIKSNEEIANTTNVHIKSNAETTKAFELATTVDSNPTEPVKNEESTEELTETATEKATEKDIYTTTEEEEATTIDDGTTISDEHEVTTLSHIPKMRPAKTKENLVVETTTTVPTTETTEIPTTIFVTTPKDEENKVHREPVQKVTPKETSVKTNESTSNTTPVLNNETDSTTQDVTKPSTHPTKPITTKTTTTETNQRIILPMNESEPTHSSSSTTLSSSSTTQKSVPRTISTTVLQVNVSTETPSPITPRIISFATTSVPGVRKSPNASSPPEHQTEVNQGQVGEPTDVNAMIAIGISVVAVVTLILLVGFLVVMRKRQKQLTYGQRCRPIGLDAYSLDNISVYNSVRRKSAMRSSKRAFGNAGFDDPGLKNNPLNISQLATFSQKRVSINEEFKEVPTVTARIEEVPIGCEDKNRYANVVPLPESRVHLKRQDDDEKTEYINANFVKGPKDTTHYYIACQAPLEQTITDFWRMIWEQNSRVIIMATDLTENGIEKCAEYLPSSFVIDNHVTFGDYQITLKNRDVRDKYAVSTVHLKNACTKTWREITHFWYQWPENGVPTDEASVIAMLLEARSFLKMVTPEQSDENGQAESDLDGKMSNGNLDKSKSLQRVQGPLTVHCSPGTGRTGTIVACDIAIRSLEQPTRNVDVPQIVYFVRRGRASAVQTREQYEFIYKVAHVYATKLTGQACDN